MEGPGGRWKVLRLLNEGRHGEVYLAEGSEGDNLVALKVQKRWTRRRQSLTWDEADILSRLDHPFIAKSFDSFSWNDREVIVLEHVAGGDLRGQLGHISGMTPVASRLAAVKIIVAEIAVGLHYLHSRDLIWRDLKPENILMTDEGHVKLIDFGTTLTCNASGEARQARIEGTLSYLAPEVVWGAFGGRDKVPDTQAGAPGTLRRELLSASGVKITQAADWWALGCVLYELLVGRTPLDVCGGGSREAHDDLQIRRIGRDNVRVSVPFDEDGNVRRVLRGLLEKDPTKRWSYARLRDSQLFADVDFGALESGTIEPQYRPGKPARGSGRARRSSLSLSLSQLSSEVQQHGWKFDFSVWRNVFERLEQEAAQAAEGVVGPVNVPRLTKQLLRGEHVNDRRVQSECRCHVLVALERAGHRTFGWATHPSFSLDNDRARRRLEEGLGELELGNLIAAEAAFVGVREQLRQLHKSRLRPRLVVRARTGLAECLLRGERWKELEELLCEGKEEVEEAKPGDHARWDALVARAGAAAAAAAAGAEQPRDEASASA
jgi:serine/threonine protein kinase